MKQPAIYFKRYTLTALTTTWLLLYGCATISVFDHYAYTQTTGLKVEALNLMNKAVYEYDSLAKEINVLLISMEKIYEYEKGRPKNEITARMWENMKNENKNLFGGFLKRWKEDKKLSIAFIEEAKKLISDAFDQIIGLESKKIKKSEITIN